eukprot:CAMPEP_0116825326 /NCGR_PEP_ID=MMETSP0418-20121206/1902_1 /TAXON_ID=1158023 /ORGANISM="Astrosyne radiata, Strain 13vi08-1A" /LENGTH=61 /DNA_ID=CAMNT_0004453819 /DNA_START=1889 /DNA_END=2070 /DNA_ORIENTATION=+
MQHAGGANIACAISRARLSTASPSLAALPSVSSPSRSPQPAMARVGEQASCWRSEGDDGVP